MLLLVMLAIALTGCTRRHPLIGRAGRDPIDRVYRIDRDSSGQFTSQSFGSGYEYRDGSSVRPPRATGTVVLPPGGKLHPALIPLLTGGRRDSLIHLIVSLRDSVPIPVFPRANTQQARTSPGNTLVLHQADSLIQVIRGMRAMRYQEDSTTLVGIPSVVIHGRFWLIQAMVVDATVARLLTLDSLTNVTYVRPVDAGEPAPTTCPDGIVDAACPDSDPSNDIATANGKIGMASWKGSGATQGWLGVMDTGVNTSHVLLADAFADRAHIFQCELDCPIECKTDTTKCTDCPEGNPRDLCKKGHGTSTAGILVGHKALFTGQEGMTSATLDWYSVYDQPCTENCGGTTPNASVNACAAVRAIEFAIRRGNPVLIAEIAVTGDDRDPIDRSAAHAFETGTAVIAAAGNTPDGDPVATPAREATVIGVGARYLDPWVADTDTRPFQRFGSVNGRLKPDILAPTETEAPSRCSDHSFTFFGFTSGATPYVGGTASILNEWLFQKAGVTDPGNTYAQIIVSGSLTGPFTNAKCGVGLLGVAPPSSTRWVGKTELGSNGSVTIDLPGATNDLVSIDAALWWPEQERTNGTRPHRQVMLELLNAAGNPVATSNDPNNVFQRVSVARSSLGPLTSNIIVRIKWMRVCLPWGWGCFSFPIPVFDKRPWTIRITEQTSMPDDEVQTVYWTSIGRR
jgi:hypothetical protein